MSIWKGPSFIFCAYLVEGYISFIMYLAKIVCAFYFLKKQEGREMSYLFIFFKLDLSDTCAF